jgi:hypothetical protein
MPEELQSLAEQQQKVSTSPTETPSSLSISMRMTLPVSNQPSATKPLLTATLPLLHR